MAPTGSWTSEVCIRLWMTFRLAEILGKELGVAHFSSSWGEVRGECSGCPRKHSQGLLLGWVGLIATAKVELLFQAGAAGAGRVRFPVPPLLKI